MIQLQDVSRTYASDEVETTALGGIDLHIEKGEFVAIMGPSGCGKSTLLNILGTIDRPSGGRYLFEGKDIAKAPEADLARLRRDRLGFVFQSFNLIDELTIAENVALGLAYRSMPAREKKERIAAAMDRVGIAHRQRHHPHQLSGGQQQRAAIARAIVGEPRLILADEPTGNLDTANGAQVMEILQQLNAEGATIVMVTHSPAHADIARRTVHMLDGRILASARLAA
ncbi:ABC transporter ATP-binding protein [Sphingomonas sanguinis]|jgi:putative ABC transport system ATP-binding protein|uniref:ABC transporter ATP-binding protein n=1 Tax=Sphingomonas sanguinis TaxID=33051 RepID=A0A7Y7UTQ0_9SPHN|nr:ABC transporter ATP-binding protein [Sphingomonas sanguinis]MBZ6383947.1 ABC transporter ATP-binding protein [Sphingomonas sanguinis]NNG50679.1 ABC transporter ATP-binding protein [Sphingomonas sanguinis]NNG52802.1 ABC transporter ATP-binding protein [Sphingomonas sanguinis]NVP33238.1 ABC transporter ATP-binding protein [Sphingomonas sanguinis]